MNNFRDSTDTLNDIIHSLRKPLRFAAKSNFSHLNTIKNLAELVVSLTDEVLHNISDPEIASLLNTIRNNFRNYNGSSEKKKHKIIENALTILDGLVSYGTSSEASQVCKNCKNDSSVSAGEPGSIPITAVRGIGAKTASVFHAKGIHTVEDLLYFIPRTYSDQRKACTIQELQPGQHATIVAVVETCTVTASKRFNKKILTLTFVDETGFCSAKWFNISSKHAQGLQQLCRPGHKIVVSGEVSTFNFNHEMHHPEISPFKSSADLNAMLHIKPVYTVFEGITQKRISSAVEHALSSYIAAVHDVLPRTIQKRHKLLPLAEALETVHRPSNDTSCDSLNSFTSPGHRRLVFDEFFFLQTVLALKKRNGALVQGTSFMCSDNDLSTYISRLPFKLTGGQTCALNEIFSDMRRSVPMNRLLQGDVGCGKTVVAFLSAMIAVSNEWQCAFMAPTEILAEQLFNTISDLSSAYSVKPVLITGGSSPKKNMLLSLLQSGEAHIAVGTHALIQESVTFHRLGLVVVDEQHRFGVMQRSQMREKGNNPDMLVMTATPIPRTLGLTVYGDLDISTITTMPEGRKKVETKVCIESQRDEAYGVIRSAAEQNRQSFIIYPLVEESDKLDLMSVKKMSSRLRHDVFPEIPTGFIHGKMSRAEKDSVMEAFRSNTIKILAASTVVEVGIDIPNASVMLVEHAERFGLSQLHQLRGRVGRGTDDAVCILMANCNKSDTALRRLEIMEKTTDGFRIAEEDFAMRGPGEFIGTRQSGIPDFRIAHLIRDAGILREARSAAFQLVESDPDLSQPENRILKNALMRRWKGNLSLAGIG